MKENSSFQKIYEVVRRIPSGTVATYGQIAALAGNRHWARVVGYALHANPDPDHIPCYRVVNRNGQVSSAFAFGGKNRQIELLEATSGRNFPCRTFRNRKYKKPPLPLYKPSYYYQAMP